MKGYLLLQKDTALNDDDDDDDGDDDSLQSERRVTLCECQHGEPEEDHGMKD